MAIRLGYVCIHTKLPPADRTCRLKNATSERILELGRENLLRLAEVLRWNARHGVAVFRVSSDTIPFGSHPVNDVPWWDDLRSELKVCRELAQSHGMRLSMHPGQFTVLNSLRPEVIENSLRELEYSVRLLEALGAHAPTNKVVIHLGGTYGDKEQSLNRLIAILQTLSRRIRQHLVLENDEWHYTLKDAIRVSRLARVPVVFDVFHHEWNPSFDGESIRSLIARAAATWRKSDGRVKIHYSNQWKGRPPGTHSQSVDVAAFRKMFRTISDLDLDIMLEVKDKQESLLKIRRVLPELAVQSSLLRSVTPQS